MHEQKEPAERSLSVALTQWGATRDLPSNLDIATDMIREASIKHADLVVLPENCLCLGTNLEMRAAALSVESAPVLKLKKAAADAGVTVVLGGFKRKDRSVIWGERLFLAVGRSEEYHLRLRVQCWGGPDIAAPPV